MAASPPSQTLTGMDRLYAIAMFIALGIVILRGVLAALTPQAVFAEIGNDDIMRLMSARDWLAGQGWYDMTQHRMLPDEGLSLHWSRYVDLGYGGIVWLFALIVPTSLAEQLGGIVWPIALVSLLIVFVGRTTRRLLGPAAAGIAMLMVVCYPPLALGYFGVGRLDHHNVQILLMTIAALSLVRTHRTAKWGAIAGTSAALSLAVGLEALFMVVAVSLLHVIDAAFDRQGARPRLFAYCLAVFGGAVILFAGQTPPSEWLVAHCDELAPPILSLAGIGAASGLVGLAVSRRVSGPIAFLAAVCIVVVIGSALAWPLLSPCLQAPYANLPIETQEIIAARIIEAQPLFAFYNQYPSLAGTYFGIPIAVLFLATGVWVRQVSKGERPRAVGHLLVIGWIGLLASFWQMRQVVILATVVPVLAGYVVAPVLSWRLAERSGRSQLTLYGVGAVTLFQPVLLVLADTAAAALQAPRGEIASEIGSEAQGQDEACYDLAQLSALNGIPPTTILTGTNLGPRMIMVTHHSGLAAPYHRSDAALTNGFSYQISDPFAFDAKLQDLGADVFVVCRGSYYGNQDAIGTRLAAGEVIPGFDPIALGTEDVMVFRRTGLDE